MSRIALGDNAAPLPLATAAPQLLAACNEGVLLTTFTDAGGFLTALNWASHVRNVGRTPTIGVDGPLPSTLAPQWRTTNALAYSLPTGAVYSSVASSASAASSAAQNGLERWTARWIGLAALLDAGVPQVVLSDTDVSWVRDPTPYFAALARLHPRLDIAIGTDHATYAEGFRDDVPYSATSAPTRRDLLRRWQRIRTDGADDFDLDPHPVNGAKDGTWNPGVLVARATPGGKAFVAAEIDALHAASSPAGLKARALSSAAMVRVASG